MIAKLDQTDTPNAFRSIDALRQLPIFEIDAFSQHPISAIDAF